MNIRRMIYLPFVVSLEDYVDEYGEEAIEEVADTREPYLPISQTFHDEIFQHIEPGVERTVIVLKAEGMTPREISFVTGLDQTQVYTVLQKIKKRLTPLLRNRIKKT